EHFFPSAFFGTLHEAGHGLYEQGADPELERTPLAARASLGLHESQSRLWQNLVARSRAFWRHYYGPLQRTFPDALADLPADAFYRASNRVRRSLIGVEADELTYNLHVVLRFELETPLVGGKELVRDPPALRHDTDEAYLGVHAETVAHVVRQQVDGWLLSLG